MLILIIATSPYARGRSFEYAVKRKLEHELGYICFRSPASKSPADLICLKRGAIPLVIQCKLDHNLSRSEREALCALAERIGAQPRLAYRRDHKILLEVI